MAENEKKWENSRKHKVKSIGPGNRLDKVSEAGGRINFQLM